MSSDWFYSAAKNRNASANATPVIIRKSAFGSLVLLILGVAWPESHQLHIMSQTHLRNDLSRHYSCFLALSASAELADISNGNKSDITQRLAFNGGYPAISFSTVTQVLPSAIFRIPWYKRKVRYLIETAGFILVAGARFELTTFRL